MAMLGPLLGTAVGMDVVLIRSVGFVDGLEEGPTEGLEEVLEEGPTEGLDDGPVLGDIVVLEEFMFTKCRCIKEYILFTTTIYIRFLSISC